MSVGRRPSLRTLGYFGAGAAILGLAGASELGLGRKIWGIGGRPGIWAGDVNSEHNSQYLFDPYSFSHVTHGILLYGLLTLFARKSSLHARFLSALALEAGWEVLENTNFVIERYRAATISLHYYGDSVMNSMCDVLTCMAGFLLAAILPTRVSIAAVFVLELGLGLWIRDGLFLNILMLVHPIPAIRLWQNGN